MGAEVSSEQDVEHGVLAGSCECGAVRYRVADAFLYASNCHCSRCRAATGSAFKPFAGIEREKLDVMDGADALLVHGDENLNDTRCAACGSLLFSVVRDGEYVHVALGSLQDAPTLRPTKHIFVGSKAPWYEITDDLPQFEEHAQARESTPSLKSVGAITLFVEDPQRSKAFYEEVFDVSAIYEDESSAAVKFDNLIVNLLALPAADDLIAPGTVATREAGSRFQLTIWVDDTDAVRAELAKRGVELLNGPTDREWGMRTASFTDPDGHIWEVAQELS